MQPWIVSDSDHSQAAVRRHSYIDATFAGRTGEIVKQVKSSGYYQDGPMVYLQSTNVEMIRLPAIIGVRELVRLLLRLLHVTKNVYCKLNNRCDNEG